MPLTDVFELDLSGSIVRVTITTRHPISGMRFTLDWDAQSEWAASLLLEHIQKAMGDSLQGIRATAYQAGWTDAKSHKAAKQTWFSRLWRD